MKTILSFLFILFVFVSTSFSQRVIPSDAVQNHVNVRASNSAGSEIINTLRPGESAEYIESVPYWHKVRCDNGDEGYVSKRWTHIDDGTSEDEGKDELVIGSWNIKYFGTCKRLIIDSVSIADIFEKYDVIVIQEVSSNVCTRPLNSVVNELKSRGLKYEYLFSGKTGYTRNNPDNRGSLYERLGIFWDIDRVEIDDSDGNHHHMHDPILDNHLFRQVPIIADFAVKSPLGFDFRVVSVHAAYSPAIHEVRAEEFRYINQWLIDQMNDPNNQEKDIFVMGDFNSNPKGQPHYFDTIIGNATEYRVAMNEPPLGGEDPIKTTILVPTSNDPDKLTSPVYDHILISRQAGEEFPQPLTWASGLIGVIQFDQDQKWQNAERDETIYKMSDHRPIWIKLDYNTEDRD